MGLSASTMEHTPTPEDVFTVRGLLLTLVPLELADLILEEAKYWPKVSCSFKPEKPWELANNAVCCLLTPKLRDLLRTRMNGAVKVKTVCFKIVSHDQGWCSENDFPQPYEGSYTWFEAIIVRDHICQYAVTGSSDGEEIYHALDLRGKDDKDHECEVVTVKNPNDDKSDVWNIQRNKRASNEDQLHTVVWMEEEEGSADESKLMNETGRGLGRGFVRSLEMGDRIAVMVRAQYPGWVNYMKSVELEIHYSV